MDKIKVVISGLIFPLTMLHYFWRAFEHREDVDLFVTGPYFDDYIPWNYGMKLPRQYVKVPHYPLPQQSANFPGRLPASFVQPQLPWEPDLWLQIDAGWHFADRPPAKVVGLVETDPHVLKQLYQQPKKVSDFVWCMQTPYMEAGDIYLPYGYDSEYHQPMDVEKIHDACLIGLHYEKRDALVNCLKSRGLDVYYSIGEVYDQYQLKYNQSKIALSWSSMMDLPARVWEAFAMGVPLVTNRVPDLATNGFIEGVHYLGFDNVDEGEKAVMTLLVDDELRHDISHAAWMKVTGNDSWDDRVEKILVDAGIVS